MKNLNHAHNIFTFEDLHHRGYSREKVRNLVHQKQLIALRRGIYIDAQTWDQLSPWEQYRVEITAYGRWNPEAVFSHQTAALLHNLPLLHSPPEKLHVLTSYSSRGRARKIARHIGAEKSYKVLSTQGFLCTDVARTVLDCAKSLPLVEGLCIADSALHQSLISYEHLAEYLASYQGRFALKVHQVASLMSALSESPGESGTRLLLAEMNLEFEEQKVLNIGGFSYRVDFYLPQFNLVIEFDGEIKYTDFGPADDSIRRERRREKEIVNAGYRVFRTTWQKVFFQPSVFKRELAVFLARTTS